jgi:hypothetical protein
MLREDACSSSQLASHVDVIQIKVTGPQNLSSYHDHCHMQLLTLICSIGSQKDFVKKVEKNVRCQVPMAHDCNPSYMGSSSGEENSSSRLAWDASFVKPSLNQ